MFALGNEVESNESREGFAQDDSALGIFYILINLMTLTLKWGVLFIGKIRKSSSIHGRGELCSPAQYRRSSLRIKKLCSKRIK